MKLATSKFIGGILLIIGTTIGGGMLALPISNAQAGFSNSSLLLLFSWFVMTVGALFILEVNLWFAPGKNIITMVDKTLGKPFKIIAWICYLLLLYSLLAAYISGGSDVFQGLLKLINIKFPEWFDILVFTFLFGTIVYLGIYTIDRVNRLLMFSKFLVYVILLILIAPHLTINNLSYTNFKGIPNTLMILITSFGFATIIPSLRSYFNDDVKKLRLAIIIGSFVPLICYIAWDLFIIGTLPSTGVHGILNLIHSQHTTTDLTRELSIATQSHLITNLFRFFSSICMLTAFLGVSLCLTDFLSDGLNLPKKGKNKILIFTLTFLPPLAITIFSPGIFITSLEYAGIFSLILLLLLPTMMIWSGRYRKNLSLENNYKVKGGKIFLISIFIISIILLTVAILQIN